MAAPTLAPSPQLDYFTCTLAEALVFNLSKGARVQDTESGSLVSHEHYSNLNDFLDLLANRYGDRLAIGCVQLKRGTQPGSQQQVERLTFRRIRDLVRVVALQLRGRVPANGNESDWVALLSSSSIVFAVTWLALIRAGFKVLLIAPQSSPDAVRHLLQQCKAKAIFHDTAHAKLAREAANGRDDTDSKDTTTLVHTLWVTLDDLSSQVDENVSDACLDGHSIPNATEDAYAFHSSGTTGLPKLIPQTHHGAVGVLPLLQGDGVSQSPTPATYTTTPLYHGGIADMLRCWSAAAPIFVFAETAAAMTGTNVLSCIKSVQQLSMGAGGWPTWHLAYFSCVPFILETMVESQDALQVLQEFDMVGVGGASMPETLGNELVQHGVKLVSRFGSSECGFLLSSNRDFEADDDWHVLRVRHSQYLQFRKVDSGDELELIVPSSWPVVSTAPHARRPFNTRDVFLSGPGDTYTYKGRSDAQLTLKTGKKFDPSTIETQLRLQPVIHEAVVIGEGLHAPGVLLFSSNPAEAETDAVHPEIWTAVRLANEQSPSHARISRQSIYVLSKYDLGRLRKNNKGGVIRSSLKTDFSKEIQYLSGNDAVGPDSGPKGIEEEPPTTEFVFRIIKSTVEEQLGLDDELGPEDDFFEAGLNSTGCIAVCRQLSGATRVTGLNLNTIYECGTISALTEHVMSLVIETERTSRPNVSTSESSAKAMLQLVEQQMQRHISLDDDRQSYDQPETKHDDDDDAADHLTDQVILMTGATGFLGVHLLQLLQDSRNVTRIYALVRGSRHVPYQEQQERAQARLEAALKFHCRPKGSGAHYIGEKIRCIPYLFRESDLGLPTAVYQTLVRNVTHVVHAAWEVNFGLPLKSFASHVQGTVNLFHLSLCASAANRNISFIFCSSVASIANATKPLDLAVSSDPHDASPIGYSQSKWVAENVLQRLSQRHSHISTKILRVGQLSGDTRTGIWNPREAWPLMFSASLSMSKQGCQLPDLAETTASSIDWLPVDLAAQQVLQHLVATHSSLDVSPVRNSVHVIPWSCAQKWAAAWAKDRKLAFVVLPAQSWLRRLEGLTDEHQAKALIPLWRDGWRLKSNGFVEEPGPYMQSSAPLNEKYFRKLLDWVKNP